MTLTTRLAVAMILLVAVAVSAVGWLSYRNLEQALLQRARDRIETQSRLIATDLEYYASGAIGDVAGFHAAAALHGLIRARRAGGIDPVDGLSEKTWRDRLANRLAAELKAKPSYALFRIIGVDDDGREVVRVDRMGANDAIRIVPESELQKRGDRSYFRNTIGLERGKIYVSPLDLGRRNGLIEDIHRPTLRVATPIFADDGKPFGIFIINVDMRPALDRVRTSVPPGETIYVVNRQAIISSTPIVLASSASCWASRTTGEPISRIWPRGPALCRAARTSSLTARGDRAGLRSLRPFWPAPNGSA